MLCFGAESRALACSECSWIHCYICSTRFPSNCSSSFPGTIKPMSCRPSGECPMTCSSYWEVLTATMKWCNPINSMCWLSRYQKKNPLTSNIRRIKKLLIFNPNSFFPDAGTARWVLYSFFCAFECTLTPQGGFDCPTETLKCGQGYLLVAAQNPRSCISQLPFKIWHHQTPALVVLLLNNHLNKWEQPEKCFSMTQPRGCLVTSISTTAGAPCSF